jgi:ABC-2 type transport system permease protein
VNVRAPERAVLGVIADATNEFAWARAGSTPPIKLRPMSNVTGERTFDYAGYVMTGILVVSMLSTCIMGTILPLAARREGHLLRIFSAFPVRASAVMWSILTSRVVLVFGFGAIFLLGAHLLYGVTLPGRADGWFSLAAVSAVGSFTFLSLALAVASRVGNMQSATMVSNLVYMPLILFSDLTLPLGNFPEIVQSASDFLPVHAFVESIRGIILSGDTLLQHGRAVLVMALWAAAFSLVGRRLFALQSA